MLSVCYGDNMKKKIKYIILYILGLSLCIFCIVSCLYDLINGINTIGSNPIALVSYFGMIAFFTYIFIKDMKGEDV